MMAGMSCTASCGLLPAAMKAATAALSATVARPCSPMEVASDLAPMIAA